MYHNAFNTLEKNLRAEGGISNELGYVEQTSWLLFLEYLHDLEIGTIGWTKAPSKFKGANRP